MRISFFCLLFFVSGISGCIKQLENLFRPKVDPPPPIRYADEDLQPLKDCWPRLVKVKWDCSIGECDERGDCPEGVLKIVKVVNGELALCNGDDDIDLDGAVPTTTPSTTTTTVDKVKRQKLFRDLVAKLYYEEEREKDALKEEAVKLKEEWKQTVSFQSGNGRNDGNEESASTSWSDTQTSD